MRVPQPFTNWYIGDSFFPHSKGQLDIEDPKFRSENVIFKKHPLISRSALACCFRITGVACIPRRCDFFQAFFWGEKVPKLDMIPGTKKSKLGGGFKVLLFVPLKFEK